MKILLEEIELGPVLGIGTVGTVKLGTLKKTGEKVAVKFLQHAISIDQLVCARFRREVEILEKLRHPNIVKYYGDGKHDGQLFYVMEALQSGTLREMLEHYGAMTWQEVASVARQVCSALQHSHNHGIIHRDLKPGNLFLTAEGQVKLGDFGIARDNYAADLTSDGLTVGTHAYMSPEQITAEGPTTGKADLYSLGCVLFELLTGRKPFQGTNFAVLFDQHLNKPAPDVREFVADCPDALSRTIGSLLEKDPEKRPFSARAVQADMLKLLESTQPLVEGDQEDLHTAADVGAGSVIDPGMVSLARKLAPYGGNTNASWRAFIMILAIVAAVIFIAAVVSKS